MKTIIYKREYVYKNLKNKTKYIDIEKSRLSRNTKNNLFREKQNSNISENLSLRKLKKIKNFSSTFFPTKTIYHNNSTYLPIDSISKKNKNFDSLIKIKINHSNKNKKNDSNYRIYLSNKFGNLTFYKKNGQNFFPTKDYNNIKSLKINQKLNNIPNKRQFKLTDNIENKHSLPKVFNDLSKSNNRKVLIQEPTPILENNSDIKGVQTSSIAQNKLNEVHQIDLQENKIESFINYKDEFKKKDYTEFSLEQIPKKNNIKLKRNSNIIIPKIINNNNLISAEPIASQKKDNDSVKNVKNIINMPKIIKNERDSLANIKNYNNGNTIRNNHLVSSKISQNLNLIKIMDFYQNNIDINNINEIPQKKILSLSYTSSENNNDNEEVGQETNKNENNDNFNLNLNNIENNNFRKIKFLNIIPIKKPKIKEKNVKFLNKIKKNNKYDNKYYNYKKNIKKNKILILTKKINFIHKLLSELNENSKIKILIPFIKPCLNNLNIFLPKYKVCYNEIESEFNYISFLLLYSNYKMRNIGVLDCKIVKFLSINNSFSSIYLPLVNLSKKRATIFMKGKLYILQKEKALFEDKKTKFIEPKKIQKNFQNITLKFLSKDINSNYSNYLDSIFTNTKDNINYKFNSLFLKKKTFSKKNKIKSLCFSSQKSIKNYTRHHHSNEFKKKLNNFSILQKRKLFEIPNKGNEIKPIRKTFKKRTVVDSQNKLKRLSIKFFSKNIKAYFNLIKNNKHHNFINDLKNLIKEGEEFLFLEYLNFNSSYIDINSLDEDGNSFLILSVKHNLNNLSKALINKGIDINIQNKFGNTALHYALSDKNFYMADILRKFGAIEDSINNQGYTPWDCINKNIDNDN